MTRRVLIVDDHRMFCEGLKTLLEGRGGITVVGTASDGRRGVQLATELKPDVVTMDVAMPDLNGIEATRQIVAAVPSTRVVALSMHRDRRYVIGILRAGASGYVLKDCAFEELETAIQAVMAHQVYLSPAVASVVIDDLRSDRPSDEGGVFSAALTPREREVLQLVAEGLRPREIAAKLFVSVKTVETHRRNVQEKLGARSPTDLVKAAIREGLVRLD